MITDMTSGQKITEYFILRRKDFRTKKDNNETYLSVELGDASGRIFGSVWGTAVDIEPLLKVGQLVKVKATVIDWHGRPFLSINKIRPVNDGDGVSLEHFIPRSKKAPEKLFDEFTALANKVENEPLKRLLQHIINDEHMVASLKRAPAGKLWHHCYLGGLLEHSINVAHLALSIAEHYPSINRDLLLTGALVHDIGKIVEYNWDGLVDFSDVGRLHGHICIGYALLACLIDTIQDFPASLRNELLHLVLSHQGKQEHGSPVPPMTREAFVLSYADDIDSKLAAFDRIHESEMEPGKKWSSYVKLLDRFLYFGQDSSQQ
ncbi:HD domain-containing protein [candidate division KSB1 bacterium]|nr:HD domain-containing protein [candidate division KSB1 bacterium]